MNFIILGSELPDYNHPSITKYNSGTNSLKYNEQLRKALNVITSENYQTDMENLRVHYKQKMQDINSLFQKYLSDVATINLPNIGLGIWIALNTKSMIGNALPELEYLKLYNNTENPHFDSMKPINGIRLGFGHFDLDTFEIAFKCLSLHLK